MDIGKPKKIHEVELDPAEAPRPMKKPMPAREQPSREPTRKSPAPAIPEPALP